MAERPQSNARSDQDHFQVVAPQLALPKGGGAIRGIREKFVANPVTGTGTVTVPIAVSSGRSGFGPQLTLTYDSGSGNGPFGLGWSRFPLKSYLAKNDIHKIDIETLRVDNAKFLFVPNRGVLLGMSGDIEKGPQAAASWGTGGTGFMRFRTEGRTK